ncbi:hypothetical protein K492DRAFT_173518 [Lichtheimia hyalospora FSU 10163]|nr:hypothetical protein K492DRAFT_173518 [Lichtheimia hyalospora FSU 10163]
MSYTRQHMVLPRLTPTAIPQPWFAKKRSIEEELQELEYEEDRYTRERALALTTKYDAIQVDVPDATHGDQKIQQRQMTPFSPNSQQQHLEPEDEGEYDDDNEQGNYDGSSQGSVTPQQVRLMQNEDMVPSSIPASPEFSDDDMMLSF